MRAVVVDATSNSLPYDVSLCEALRRRGVKVTLACSRAGDREPCAGDLARWDWFDESARRPMFARAGRHVRQFARALEHVSDMRRLANEVRLARPDVVHFQWLPIPVVDTAFVSAIRRVCPVVLTVHNTTLERGQFSSPLQRLGYRRAIRNSDAVVVHTEFSRSRLLSQKWLEIERIHVIPHGALEYYRSLAEQDVRRDDPRTIVLFFGRIVHYKGVDLLIRAFGALPSALRDDCRLVIAGQPGCDIAELKRLSANCGVADAVDWDIRYIPERELASLVRAADLVVFPYRSIDQSGALMMAVAFDKPIIATRVGGFSESLRDTEHGYVVEPEDVRGLSAALKSLVSDPTTRARMSEAVRSLRQRNLSWDAIAGKTLTLYSSLVHRTGSVRPQSGGS